MAMTKTAMMKSTGNVYVINNDPADNALLMYARQADGSLAASGMVSLKGKGLMGGANEQGAVRVQGDYVLAVNPGSDTIAVPSRFEPCGLTQLYGLRYGTLPIVHRVGGLADTVVDADEAALREDRATGFTFEGASPDALARAMRR